jgi:pimeloyl-ACP methyl ester carboxylesterase
MAGPREDLQTRAEFDRAYEAAVRAWPVPVESREIRTDHGTTHVLVSGRPDAPLAVLLPGGGATATAWAGLAGALSGGLRTAAVDPLGQPGRSRPGCRPVVRTEDLTDWLDQLVGALTAEPVVLVGHSYGAWMALRYGLHAPGRVRALVLVDPSDCFSGLGLRYRLRAVPLVLRPSGERLGRLLAWETGGRPLDPTWLEVACLGADLGRPSIVLPRRPSARELSSLAVPTLVAVAAHSRAHDPETIARRARAGLPQATVTELATATHHTLPTEDVAELAGAVTGFLCRDGGGQVRP